MCLPCINADKVQIQHYFFLYPTERCLTCFFVDRTCKKQKQLAYFIYEKISFNFCLFCLKLEQIFSARSVLWFERSFCATKIKDWNRSWLLSIAGKTNKLKSIINFEKYDKKILWLSCFNEIFLNERRAWTIWNVSRVKKVWKWILNRGLLFDRLLPIFESLDMHCYFHCLFPQDFWSSSFSLSIKFRR